MKITLVSIFLLGFQICFSQRIENLNSDNTVIEFIRWLYRHDKDSGSKIKDKPLSKYLEDSCKSLYTSLGIRFWDKGDFDNNGKMDLLFNGYEYGQLSIVAMQFPNDSFAIHYLSGSTSYCRLPKIIRQDSRYLISFFQSYPDYNNKHWGIVNKTDSLVYKYDGFIEENNQTKNYSIEKIEFSTDHCYGLCPVLEMTIDSSLKISYKGIAYNNPDGEFEGMLDKKIFEEITQLLNFIDFLLLRDNYSVSWTDSQTATLIITYNGGKRKKIVDYGEMGTFGLSRLYQLLFSLRYSIKWTKA